MKFADGAVPRDAPRWSTDSSGRSDDLRPAIKVQLTYRDLAYDVMPMLQQLAAETRRHLEFCCSVSPRRASRDGADWSPMDVARTSRP